MWLGMQLDFEEEMGPLRGMYGSMEAEYEVQRIIKRADLWTHEGPCGQEGNNLWLRKGENDCVKPGAGDPDLWINIWEELNELVKIGILEEVAHVKAHRTKKEKEKMEQFERFVAEGNEKPDELSAGGAMMDVGFMAEAGAETMKQERDEVYVALQYAASFHCLVEEWKDCEELEETKHRTEWCADANKYRCMRCGRGSKNMKMHGKCTGPTNLGKWSKRHLGGHDVVRGMDQQGKVLIWCRKMLGPCETENGAKINELLQVGESRHK